MIRPATAADAAEIAAIYRPFCEDNCVSFETVAPDAAEIAARIERISQRFPYLVDESDGRVNGYAYASAHRERAAYRWAVEVTVYLRERSRQQGIGRALYTELVRRLRDQGLYKAYAGILIPNPPSQAFHEALGFKLVGVYHRIGFKLGAWRDVGWWQKTLRESVPDTPPAEPGAPRGGGES